MIGEAVSPNADYEETVQAIEDCLEQNVTATADLGQDRYFLAGSLAVMRQHGAEDDDDGLVLCIGVVHEEHTDNIKYALTLSRYQDGHEVEDSRTTELFHSMPSPEDLEQYDPDDGEDWRARLAAVACDVFESWYQLDDHDIAPVVQAACWGDEDGQRAVETWQALPERHKLRAYRLQRRRERRKQREEREREQGEG